MAFDRVTNAWHRGVVFNVALISVSI